MVLVSAAMTFVATLRVIPAPITCREARPEARARRNVPTVSYGTHLLHVLAIMRRHRILLLTGPVASFCPRAATWLVLLAGVEVHRYFEQ